MDYKSTRQSCPKCLGHYLGTTWTLVSNYLAQLGDFLLVVQAQYLSTTWTLLSQLRDFWSSLERLGHYLRATWVLLGQYLRTAWGLLEDQLGATLAQLGPERGDQSLFLRRLERRLFITDEEKVYGTIKEIAVYVTWISLFSFSGDTELEHFQ